MSDDAERVAAFMESRAAGAADESDDDDAALEAARRERLARRAKEAIDAASLRTLRAAAGAAAADARWMDAAAHLTDAAAIAPHDVDILVERASVCAKMNRYNACLHDGELIISLMPDWYRGHAICGSALFCLKEFAAAARRPPPPRPPALPPAVVPTRYADHRAPQGVPRRGQVC